MQFQVMEEFGPGHDAIARRLKARAMERQRIARMKAQAHRPALVATEVGTHPKRVVFQTPHGPAYMVERFDTLERSRQRITLPYVTMLDR